MLAPRMVIGRGARSDSGTVPSPRQCIALQFAVLISCYRSAFTPIVS
jgi:hypothetical protein